MFFDLKRKLNFAQFDLQVRGVVQTPPASLSISSNVVCVSHVCRMYLYAYLIAIKSFMRHVPVRKVYAVDDLTLTDENKTLLREHVPGIEIVPITEVKNQYCPSSGDWEGFLIIGSQAAEHFCIQLDADTVTMGPLPEVLEAVRDNRCFTLGEWVGQEIGSATDAAEAVKDATSDHVQILSERHLHRLDPSGQLRYVRGCGAFAGFAKGEISVDKIERLSKAMTEILGWDKWRQWGSQQVPSNVLVANAPGARVLPVPKYASHMPSIDIEQSVFRHYIGSHRFENGSYVRSALKAIGDLNAVPV
jgi:hypothetical protein